MVDTSLKNILHRNLSNIKERIYRAAERVHRNPSEVKLVAVTKTVGFEIIRILAELGQYDIGENRVQDGLEKARQLGPVGLRYHLIGHLQTNKIKKALSVFDIIQSIDSVNLAEEIQKEAEKNRKYIEALIEINISDEKSKFGIKPTELFDFYRAVSGKQSASGGIIISGLMTMTPLIPTDGSPELSRNYFRRTKELFKELKSRIPEKSSAQFKHLSMGMSQDFEVAVEEGASLVRVGTALFEGI